MGALVIARGRLPTSTPRQACSVFAVPAALSAVKAAATSSTTDTGGWMWEAARGQSPKLPYPRCHLLQKATPPRVRRATSL